MDLRMKREHHLILTPEEFRLVQRALRCQLTDEEQAPALALQEQMLLTRHKVLQQELHESEKAAANIAARRGASAHQLANAEDPSVNAAGDGGGHTARVEAGGWFVEKRGAR